jgi:hypothetical protein
VFTFVHFDLLLDRCSFCFVRRLFSHASVSPGNFLESIFVATQTCEILFLSYAFLALQFTAVVEVAEESFPEDFFEFHLEPRLFSTSLVPRITLR